MNEFDLKSYISKNPLIEAKIANLKSNSQDSINETPTTELNEESTIEETTIEETTIEETKVLTKESLKSLIREKITSILNEETIEEAEEDEKAPEAEEAEDEKSPEAEEAAEEAEAEEAEAEDSISKPVLDLLSKAREEAEEKYGEIDPELENQIGNVITYFSRQHLAGGKK